MKKIEDDEYRGAIYLELGGQSVPQAVNVNLTIRDGPSLALGLLILGAAFGWLSKWVTEKGEQILAANDRSAKLTARAAADLSHADVAGLGPAFGDVRADIDANEIDRATSRMGLIESAIDLLRDLARIEDRIF